jgi:M6 family metalloprotease-like protein
LLLQKLFFASGGSSGEPSVNDFYTTASNGNISLAGQVVGPYLMPYNLSYYANNNSGMSDQEPNTRTLGQHAAEAVNRDNALGRLTGFDNNGDGYMVRACQPVGSSCPCTPRLGEK